MTIVCVFGDSITYGANDIEFGGWVHRLRKFLDGKSVASNHSSFFTYNLGISGDNTIDLLKRFKTEAKARLSDMDEGEEIIIIFSIGINDSQFIHDKSNFRVSKKEFKENIQKLLNLAKDFTSKIIFVGLTPLDETKTTPIPWNTNKSYKNEYVKSYNEIIKSVCEENKTHFIEIFEKIIKKDYKNLLSDGLHPNSEGHEILFDLVKEFLTDRKII